MPRGFYIGLLVTAAAVAMGIAGLLAGGRL